MGDPLSMTASIIAVTQMSGFLLSTLGKYIKDAKNASKDISLLQEEVKSIERVTADTQALVDKYTAQTLSDRETLRLALEGCKKRMDQINTDLVSGVKRKLLRKMRISRSLEWPFDKKEVENMINDLERYKGIIDLSIQTNHIQISARTEENVTKVHNDVIQTQTDVAGAMAEIKNTHQDVLTADGNIQKTGKDVGHLSQNVKEVHRDVIQTKTDVAGTRDEVRNTHRGVLIADENIKKTGKDVGSLTQNVKEVHKDVSQIRTDVAGTWDEVKDTHRDVLEVDKNITQTGENVGILTQNVTRNHLESQAATQKIGQDLGSLNKSVNQNHQEYLNNTENDEIKRNIGSLPFVNGASYGSGALRDAPKCLPDTRVDLLNMIETWADSNPGESIFWLCGLAGTGKSTIAQSVAERLDDKKMLGGSFFFSRGDNDRGRATKVFTTLAFQLAAVVPGYRSLLSDAISDLSTTKKITDLTIDNQWKELISGPLSKMQLQRGSKQLIFVIVIDALDECDNYRDIKRLITNLQSADFNSINLRTFLTSRPETPIEMTIKGISPADHKDLILHDLDPETVHADIVLFLNQEFDEIQRSQRVPPDWPGKDQIEDLAYKANGLFIYAATLCRYIKLRQPQKRLKMALAGTTEGHSTTPELDRMYLQILRLSTIETCEEQDKEDLATEFRTTVGSIIASFENFTLPQLAEILEEDVNTVFQTLDPLRAVLDVPGLDEESRDIQILHPSLRDFLFDQKRCTDDYLYINTHEIDGYITEQCIKIMSKHLRKNICGILLPDTSVDSINPDLIYENISSGVEYAVRNWIQHLVHSNWEIASDERVKLFLRTHILHWFESLSLLRSFGAGVESLILLVENYTKMQSSEVDSELYDLVTEGLQVARSQRQTIEETPFQLYSFAHLFLPANSSIRKFCDHDTLDCVRVNRLAEAGSGDFIMTLPGPEVYFGDPVDVTFSPDNSKVVILVGLDVRVWDTKTAVLVAELEWEPGDGVASVAFWPNDQIIIFSGVADQTRTLFWNYKSDSVETLPQTSWDNYAKHTWVKNSHSERGDIYPAHSPRRLPADVLAVSWKRDAFAWLSGEFLSWAFSNGDCQRLLAIATPSSDHDFLLTIWDCSTNPPKSQHKVFLEGQIIWKLKFSTKDRRLLCVAAKDKDDSRAHGPFNIFIYNVETSELTEIIQFAPFPKPRIKYNTWLTDPFDRADITVHSGGDILFMISSPPVFQEKYIAIWNVSTRKRLGKILLSNTTQSELTLRFSDDAETILIGGKTASLWRVPPVDAHGLVHSPPQATFEPRYFKWKRATRHASIEIDSDLDPEEYYDVESDIKALIVDKLTRDIISEIIIKPDPNLHRSAYAYPHWCVSPEGDIVAFCWYRKDYRDPSVAFKLLCVATGKTIHSSIETPDLWDARDLFCKRDWGIFTGISRDGRYFACSRLNERISVYTVDPPGFLVDLKLPPSLLEHQEKGYSSYDIIFSPDGSRLVLTERYGRRYIAFWDIKTTTADASVIYDCNHPDESQASFVHQNYYNCFFSPDGEYIFCEAAPMSPGHTYTDSLAIWHLQTGRGWYKEVGELKLRKDELSYRYNTIFPEYIFTQLGAFDCAALLESITTGKPASLLYPGLYAIDEWITWKGRRIIKIPDTYLHIGEGKSKIDADTYSVYMRHRNGNLSEFQFDPDKLDSLLNISSSSLLSE